MEEIQALNPARVISVIFCSLGTVGISPPPSLLPVAKRHTQPVSTRLGGMQETTGKGSWGREARGFGSTDSALFQKPHASAQESPLADETTELLRQRPLQHLLANHSGVAGQLQEYHKGRALPTARRQRKKKHKTEFCPELKVCTTQSRGTWSSFSEALAQQVSEAHEKQSPRLPVQPAV